jgi:hypothetical protein
MDRYAEQQDRQNNGLPCLHCGSHAGHFSFCPLINRAAAEEMSIIDEPTAQDKIIAHALGVAL